MVAAPRHVLVADDDAHVRRMITTFLRRRRYVPSEAGNGREALEAMRNGGVDLVLLDLMMPEVSGWEVLEERAKDPALMRIPVVAITAIREEAVLRAIQDKVFGLLAKPFELSALESVLSSCLGSPADRGVNDVSSVSDRSPTLRRPTITGPRDRPASEGMRRSRRP